MQNVRLEGDIWFDFQLAREQADRLEDLARQLEQRTVEALDESVASLGAAWKGGEAIRFLHRENRLREEFQNSANKLRNVAADVRRTAKRMYDAEMEAVRIASGGGSLPGTLHI